MMPMGAVNDQNTAGKFNAKGGKKGKGKQGKGNKARTQEVPVVDAEALAEANMEAREAKRLKRRTRRQRRAQEVKEAVARLAAKTGYR